MASLTSYSTSMLVKQSSGKMFGLTDDSTGFILMEPFWWKSTPNVHLHPFKKKLQSVCIGRVHCSFFKVFQKKRGKSVRYLVEPPTQVGCEGRPMALWCQLCPVKDAAPIQPMAVF